MDIYIRIKNRDIFSLNEYKQIKKCKTEFDDGFYTPFGEVITLVATVIGAGGISKIITELIKNTSKQIKIHRNAINDIEVDCVNCSVEEVKQILDILDNMGVEECDNS